MFTAPICNNDSFITAQGDLAEDLIARGCSTKLELPATAEQLEIRWQVQHDHPGCYYQCSSCTADVLIRKLNSKRYIVARRAWSIHKGAGECPHGGNHAESGALPLGKELQHVIFDTEPHPGKVGLRMKRRLKGAARNTPRFLGAIQTTDEHKRNRKRKTAYSLKGLLHLLLECAGLNRWWPGRQYATNFPSLMPFMQLCIAALTRGGFLGGLGEKLVLPEAEEDFYAAIDGAAGDVSTHPALAGRAIIVGRLFGVDDDGTKVTLTLTGMGCARLCVALELWTSLCRSFDPPKLPSPEHDHTVESLVIAVVQRQGGELRVEEAAWCRIDCHGIATASDYEHGTVCELIDLRYRFYKVLHQPVAVGPWAMLVDFLVLIAECWLILEVDPNNSAVRVPSKRRRIKRCDEAHVLHRSYDPPNDKGIGAVMPPPEGPILPDLGK